MTVQEQLEIAGLERSNSLIAACGKTDSLCERLGQEIAAMDEGMTALRRRLADNPMISASGRDDQILTALKDHENKIAKTMAELAEAGDKVDSLFEGLKNPVEADPTEGKLDYQKTDIRLQQVEARLAAQDMRDQARLDLLAAPVLTNTAKKALAMIKGAIATGDKAKARAIFDAARKVLLDPVGHGPIKNGRDQAVELARAYDDLAHPGRRERSEALARVQAQRAYGRQAQRIEAARNLKKGLRDLLESNQSGMSANIGRGGKVKKGFLQAVGLHMD